MKKLFLSITLLQLVLFVFAQPTTTIHGIYKNGYYNNAKLKFTWFDLETMTLKHETIGGRIEENGNIFFSTNKIETAYTSCTLHLGNKSTQLCLSPGDSIYVEANRPIFKESLKFTGDAAGINNFRKDLGKFNYSSDVYGEITTTYTSRLRLLNEYFTKAVVDSDFVAFEKERLRYAYYLNAIRNRSNKSYKQVDSIIAQLNFNGEHQLRYSDFRKIVTAIPGLINPKIKMEEAIAYGNVNYGNTVEQYYLLELVKSSLKDAKSLVEKDVLFAYFKSKIDVPIVIEQIENKQKELSKGRYYRGNFLEVGMIVSGWIIGLILLFLLVKNIFKAAVFKGLGVNKAKWFKYVIYLVALFILVNSVNYFSFRVLVLLLISVVIFMLHTYLIIPKVALKRSAKYYVGTLLLLYLLVITVIYFIDYSAVRVNNISEVFMALFALTLFSWFNYYVHLLAIKKTTVKGLIKDGYVNSEVVFNALLLFVVMAFFVGNINNPSLSVFLVFYTTIFLFYLQALVVVPRYFRKDKVAYFIIVNVTLLAVLAVFMVVFDMIASYNSLKQMGVPASVFDVVSGKAVNIESLLASLFVIVPALAYWYIKTQIKEQQSEGFRLFRKKEAEVAHLRSQVNPHFLFNTLNTLYAFALTEKSDKTAECIAKLANLMRFMIDDMEKESIPLKKEVSYIQDYIKLQSIRSSVEHEITVHVNIHDHNSVVIAPMLLIPFVENAFKHGLNPNKVSQLNIDVKASDHQIQFVIENSIDRKFEAYYKEKGFGIGIENVKNRLAHIYPDRHSVSIAQTNDKFIVIITLALA